MKQKNSWPRLTALTGEVADLLFDTQAAILWAIDRVPEGVSSLVDAGAKVHISIVSLWEFELKTRYHDLGVNVEQIEGVIVALDAKILNIQFSHLKTLRALPPVAKHRDPFDRLLISQALAEDLVLVGSDRVFSEYAKVSGLKAVWK